MVKINMSCFIFLSLSSSDTPVLALTATADMKSRDRVTKLLHMEKAKRVIVSPNRRNIRLGLVPTTRLEKTQCLDWIVDEVRAKAASMAPIIIYCRALQALGEVFLYLKAELGEDAWLNRDPEHKADTQLIGMFHSDTFKHLKDRVISSLHGQGNCRVVVATTALGMGVNFQNISHVVIFGPPSDTEAIVQQVGRAGRNGLQAHAVLYNTKQSIRVDKAVREVVKTGKTSCFRKALYGEFEENTESVQPGHLCCTFCHKSCSCAAPGACAEPLPNYELPKKVFVPVKSREVTKAHKTLIKDMLEKYQKDLLANKPYLFTSQAACTGFSSQLIDAVLVNCEHIFDLGYIVKYLPVFGRKHARHILQVMYDAFHDIDDMPPPFPQKDDFTSDMYYSGYFDQEDNYADFESNKESLSSSDEDF